MDKQTSDERLLKIIEGASDSRKAQAGITGLKKPLGYPAKSFKFNLAGLKNVFKNLKLNLAKINTGLIGIGVILTLIFIYTLFSAPAISKSNAAYFTPADSASIVKFISAGEAQGLMRKNIGRENLKRDFFLPAELKDANLTGQDGVIILEELKDLKLVGIIWAAIPEVMIENAKDSRTYTLKKGEFLNTQFKIKDILRNSAILEVSTQAGLKEYELR